jgi:hypothetical protein
MQASPITVQPDGEGSEDEIQREHTQGPMQTPPIVDQPDGEGSEEEIIVKAMDEASMGAEDAAKFTAIVAWVQSQEARLAALEGQAPVTAQRLGIRRRYLRELRQAEEQRKENPSSFYALFSPPPTGDVDLKSFRRVRIILRLITLAYALTWIGVHAGMDLGPRPASYETEEEWATAVANWTTTYDGSLHKKFNDWINPIEFLYTGLAETASIFELLITLPSEAGGRAAVEHFIAYQLFFMVGVVALYFRLYFHGFIDRMPPDAREDMGVGLETGFIYLVLHIPKTVLGSWVMLLARHRLYDRFSSSRYERAAEYTGALMRLMGIQLTVFIAFVASSIHTGPPSTARLMAATTLCVALPQTFWLAVCIRDARVSRDSGDIAIRLVRGEFYALELSAYGAISVFALIGLLAYFLALEGDKAAWLTEYSARVLMFSCNGVYLLALGLVGFEMSMRASKARILANKLALTRTTAEVTESPRVGEGGATDAASHRAARRTGGSPRNMRVRSGGRVVPAAAPAVV